MSMRIVIIEDEYYTRQAIKKYIQQLGEPYEVIGEAGNGQEGLELIRSMQPDLSLVDITMPIMDGIEMITAARDAGLQTLMVILTGYSEFGYAQAAVKLGVCDYLLKPLRIEDLSKCLERAAGFGRLELRIAHEAQQRQVARKAAAEDVIRARLLQNIQYPMPEQRPGLGREGIMRVKIRTGVCCERRADVPVGAAVVLNFPREQHTQRSRPVAGVKIRAQQVFRPANGDGRTVRRAAQAVIRRDGIDPDIPRDEQRKAAPEQRRDGIMREKRPVARQRGVKSAHPAAPCSQ